jgi:hypothetical protein
MRLYRVVDVGTPRNPSRIVWQYLQMPCTKRLRGLLTITPKIRPSRRSRCRRHRAFVALPPSRLRVPLAPLLRVVLRPSVGCRVPWRTEADVDEAGSRQLRRRTYPTFKWPTALPQTSIALFAVVACPGSGSDRFNTTAAACLPVHESGPSWA